MKNLKTTNILLLIIAVPLVFYLLKVLKFIFIPLFFAMFISMFFLPMMRWLTRRNVPKVVSMILVALIIAAVFKVGGELVQLASREIMATKAEFFTRAESKFMDLLVSIEGFFGIQRMDGDTVLGHYMQQENLMRNLGLTIDYLTGTLTMTLMTAFFIILLLAGSLNFQKVLNDTLIHQKYKSIKIFRRVERETVRFIRVKFIVSLLTGLSFGLACWIFGVSFPVFWGLLAFLLNFIQLLGSVIMVLLLTFFAFVEFDPSTTLLLFILVITGIQVAMGSVLEPIMMGKSFSINIIAVLVMLMLWGFIWGIPGLVLAVPITAFLKAILEQFPRTQVVANLLGRTEKEVEVE